jgi:hypothetical protein
MTINFGIFNDKDQSVVEEFDCMYCDGAGCDRCQQSGKYVSKSSRWEMNVANGNASMILSALGIECSEPCGSINANALLKAIAACQPGLMVRAQHEEGHMISCGVDHSRANRYLEKLKEIAVEAARREELVGWG